MLLILSNVVISCANHVPSKRLIVVISQLHEIFAYRFDPCFPALQQALSHLAAISHCGGFISFLVLKHWFVTIKPSIEKNITVPITYSSLQSSGSLYFGVSLDTANHYCRKVAAVVLSRHLYTQFKTIYQHVASGSKALLPVDFILSFIMISIRYRSTFSSAPVNLLLNRPPAIEHPTTLPSHRRETEK